MNTGRYTGALLIVHIVTYCTVSCLQPQHLVDSPVFSTSLQADGLTPDSIRLYWSMAPEFMEARGFNIYRGEELLAFTDSYEYIHSGLTEDTEYSYHVCATDGSQDIVCTEEVKGKTLATGSTFYVDPAAGSMSNDGSAGAPWSTLQEVIEAGFIEYKRPSSYPNVPGTPLVTANPGAPVKGGDTIMLRSGYHGELTVFGMFFDQYLTVRAQDGHMPVLTRVRLAGVSRWRLRGLTITQEAAPVYTPGLLVHIETHGWQGVTHHVILEECHIYSIDDTSSWSGDDWDTLSCSAVSSSGTDIIIEDNICRNINFGISVGGDRTVVRGNQVINFCGDGTRGNANDLVFEYNTVKNCYDVNENHDDGFQSFSVNGAPPRERVVLRGNVIIDHENYSHPLAGALQGIGCFDGLYINWIVENNLVVVDHWHGISLYGAINCIVRNNTVVNPYTNDRRVWILIHSHKDGRHSRGCIIRNNISENIIYSSDERVDHNYLTPYDYSIFVDPDAFDFKLNSTAVQVIDTGTNTLAPLIDIDKNLRPRGFSCDPGAYEFQ